jgi:allantoate deiminase
MTRKLAFGKALMARLDELATVSDDPERLTRHYLSPAHVRAMHQVAAWMAEAGMTTRIDAVGNVIGRYEASLPGAPALLVGSHIDTVTDAGRYDGNLGVLAGIAAVDALHRAGEPSVCRTFLVAHLRVRSPLITKLGSSRVPRAR